MEFLFLMGRIAFSLVIVVNGIGHLAATDQMAGYAESRGLRPARPLVLLSGAGLVLCGLGIALGVWMDLAAFLLVLLLLCIAVLMHPFWREPAESRMMEQSHFLKDLGLAGGALLLYVFASQLISHPLSLTGPFFDR